MLMSAFALTVAPATAAQACRGPIVLNSLPLISTANGQSSYSWGYVQLWWNDCNGTNYGRTVSLLSGTSKVTNFVYNSAGLQEGGASTSTTYQSLPITSPNNPAGTWGDVFIGNSNIFYYAEVDQSGADCETDTGIASCPH